MASRSASICRAPAALCNARSRPKLLPPRNVAAMRQASTETTPRRRKTVFSGIQPTGVPHVRPSEEGGVSEQRPDAYDLPPPDRKPSRRPCAMAKARQGSSAATRRQARRAFLLRRRNARPHRAAGPSLLFRPGRFAPRQASELTLSHLVRRPRYPHN